MRFKPRSEFSHTVGKRAVIPNEVRDLTNDQESPVVQSVPNAPSVGSFSRDCGIRMTRLDL
jgi:hypothetical protein